MQVPEVANRDQVDRLPVSACGMPQETDPSPKFESDSDNPIESDGEKKNLSFRPRGNEIRRISELYYEPPALATIVVATLRRKRPRDKEQEEKE